MCNMGYPVTTPPVGYEKAMSKKVVFDIKCEIPLTDVQSKFIKDIADKQEYIKVRRVPSDNYCTDCAFVDECAGDGDGTPVEGLGCPSGYVWEIVK